MPRAYQSVECDNCSNRVLVDDSSTSVVCHRCAENEYGYCENCADHYHCDYMQTTEDGYSYCYECYNERYGRCSECDTEVDIDDLDNGLCTDCQDSDNTAIRGYGYDRPSEKFHRIGDGPHYGLELEVCVRDGHATGDVAEAILASLDPDSALLWVAKEDGSIQHGFELESLPYSKQALQASLTVIEAFKDRLKGFHGDNNGLHINCDRPMSRLHCYKIARFMNDPINKCLLETVAQRQLNRYCGQLERVNVGAFKSRYCPPTTDKYSPVRIDSNRIEFRIFKANLLPQRINKAIDFSQAVIDYCADASMFHLDERNFIRFVWANRARYIDLTEYLLEKTDIFQAEGIDSSDIHEYFQRREAKARQTNGTVQTSLPVGIPALQEV